MEATTRKLVGLLEASDLELRAAAIRVITELGLSSRPVIQAVAKCLREPYEELQVAALKCLARLGARDVAPTVVPLLVAGGRLREHAMAVATAIGASVVPQLEALYGRADFHGKRSIITTLARIGGRNALAFLLKILPTEPFELQKHLTLSICEALDQVEPAQQAPVFPLVAKLARFRSGTGYPQVLIAALIIFGHFRGPALAAKARAALRSVAENRKLPPEVRRYALVSLNRVVQEARPTPEFVRFITRLLCDEDWQNIAQHALRCFERLDLPPRALRSLVDLLKRSPHFSVHIHVFDRLKGADRPEVAQAILPFLADSRFRVREAAEAALRQMPSAIESLFDVLMRSTDLEITSRVNSILRDFPQDTRARYVEPAVNKLMRLFERNDPHYAAFLEFVRAVDPEPLRRRIYKKARSLKAGKSRDRWAKIAAYLQILWDNHLITREGRYLFAVALIRQAPKDLVPAARRADLGLRVLRALIYDDSEGLERQLKADRDLDPEDYFYLGFHFSEDGEEVRGFGIAMLRHTVEKYPRSKVAGPALHKLELATKGEAREAGPGKKPAAESRSDEREAAAAGKPAAPARPRAAAPVASGARTVARKVTPRVRRPKKAERPEEAGKAARPGADGAPGPAAARRRAASSQRAPGPAGTRARPSGPRTRAAGRGGKRRREGVAPKKTPKSKKSRKANSSRKRGKAARKKR